MATNTITREEHARRQRRRRRQALGVLLAALVLIGLATVVGGIVRGVAALFDDSELMAEFESRLQTMVMFDPLPFDSLDQADPMLFREVGIWGTLYGVLEAKGSLDDYERDPETDCLILPTLEVDATLTKLLGPEYKLTHETFEDDGMTFTYLEEKQGYLIPITGQIGRYSPTVAKLHKEGGNLRVTVGYIPFNSATDDFIMTPATEPVKYMDYIFTKTDKVWYLTALEDSEMKPPEGAQPEQDDAPDEMGLYDPAEVLQNVANGEEPDPTPEPGAEGGESQPEG